MKQSPFLVAVIGVNIFIVFFLVYKNSRITELSFQKQNHEKTRSLLFKEKERLQQQLCLAHSKSLVKNYAKKELAMEKIKAHAIKTVSPL